MFLMVLNFFFKIKYFVYWVVLFFLVYDGFYNILGDIWFERNLWWKIKCCVYGDVLNNRLICDLIWLILFDLILWKW